MKRILFFFLMILSIGCFDGDRGILTELLPAPAPQQDVMPLGMNGEIAAGTGSELVVSPIPERVEELLYGGSWDEAVDDLEEVLSEEPTPYITLEGIVKGGYRLSDFWRFCAVDWYRRRFYQKYIDAGGIAIIAPSGDRHRFWGVPDEFLYAGREVILTMTSARPGLREVLSLGHEFGFCYVLVSGEEVNIPEELAQLRNVGGFFVGGRQNAQGLDPREHSGTLAVTVFWRHFDRQSIQGTLSEETLPVDVFIHEFAHAIDGAFWTYPHLFPDWGERLTAAYESAKAKALRGEGYFHLTDYAMTNPKEYWTVGAEEWFTRFHGEGVYFEENRERMLRQDPLLYGLLDAVFPAAHFPSWIRIVEGE